MQRAIYPGSFDPPHNGHIDVIERALHLCDEVLVAVAQNVSKKALFSTEERVAMIRESTAHLEGVTVTSFEGLLVNFAVENGASAVVRGLRAVSDFEYEFQMALANRQLQPDLETIFLMPSQEHIYLSSRIVKEIARHKGDVAPLVPDATAKALSEKF
jgi:pantetheine-phosphate adenylyltransferase